MSLQYTIPARLYPCLLACLPASLAVAAWFPDRFVGYGFLSSIITASGFAVLLTQLGRDGGKGKEQGLWDSWGGKPTTQLLRHRNEQLDPNTKARYHAKLAAIVPGKEHGVMIVHANVNQKLLLAMVALAPNHKATSCGPYELHSWTHKDWKKESRTVVGTFYKPNIMVFAGCEEAVKAALEVLDGKSAGITGTESPLAGRTLPGSIFVARASAIDPNTRCPVLKQTESFRVALGENKGESFYRARLVMKSTEAVDQVKAITEGFRALVALLHGSDAQAMKLIGGLKVASEGTRLDIRWSALAEDVWAAVDQAVKKWAEHKGKHRPPRDEDEF